MSIAKYWDIDSTQSIVGSIPSQLALMTALTKVYMNGNGFCGEIPSEVSALSSSSTVMVHHLVLPFHISGLGRML